MSRKPRIKVCGMREADNVASLVKLNPDYIGFIFYPPSKRYAGPVLPANIIDAVPQHIKKTGVFVNETMENIILTVTTNRLDLVQLHGDETPDFCKSLEDHSVPVIKSFPVDEHFRFETLIPYQEACSFFLFDTKTPEYGGSGKKFDWKLLENYALDKPYFLSGGIGPGDLEDIKKLNLNFYALDVNSKFETEPGIKDIRLLNQFISNLYD